MHPEDTPRNRAGPQNRSTIIPEEPIIIEGHTDSDGGEASNMRLSEERARSVRLYLVDNFDWITPVMVEAVGYGEERPRAENTTEDNKQLNRRIEFTVID